MREILKFSVLSSQHLYIYIYIYIYKSVLKYKRSVKNKQRPHSSCSVFLSQDYFGYLGFIVCVKTVKKFVLILWRMSWLICLELYWICRLLWVIYACSLYWFFQSKNMVYFSIYLCPLWFLSSVFYSFFWVKVLCFHNFFLGILFFLLQW